VTRFLLSLCLGVLSLSAAEKPNIIFFMADDMGMGDTSAYQDFTGNAAEVQLHTPQMERLARLGVRFTDAHTPSSRCTPTRYGLLTGRYPWRSRMKWWVLFGAQGDPLIEADRPTLASMLRGAGYGTGMVGKWHVGLRYRQSNGQPAAGWADADLTQLLHTTPLDHGFDFAWYTSRSHGTSGPDANHRNAAKPHHRNAVLLARVWGVGETVPESELPHQRGNRCGDQRRHDEDPDSNCERSARESQAELRRRQPGMDRNKKILGRPQVSSQWTVVQSGKRRLRGSGIEGETSAEAGNSLEATDLHGVILRVEQAIGDHIRHLTEGCGIKTTCCQSSGAETQSAGDKG